jgi:DNA end-binding protein Ku
MSRPIWKGYITFGLVNIPVVLYSAEKRVDIHLTLVDSRDKARVRYERINENTGAEVPWQDVAKGFEFDDHNYVLIKEDDIKKIAGENQKTIDIINFIDKDSLDFTYFEKPYYLVADKKGEKGYVLLRETLKKTGKIGIAKLFIRTKQYLAALIPYQDALMLDLMRYAQEIVPLSEFDFPKGSLKDFAISTKEMDVAQQLLESMSSPWNPQEYQDKYRLDLQEWIDQKIAEQHGAPATKRRAKTTKVEKTNVIDFVELLKNSLNGNKSTKKKSKPVKSQSSKTTKKRTPA